MSGPDAGFWSDLVNLNNRTDSLVERCRRAVEPTIPISREIPFLGSIEVLFENLPATYAATPAVNSDALAGNNIKQSVFTNKGSRVYVRELSFQAYCVQTVALSGIPASYEARVPNDVTNFPFNWRWNFQTSITQRWYSERRVLANAGGRARAGNHLAFREPLIIEPMETFIFECELLGGFGMNPTAVEEQGTDAVVAMTISGYREGV